LEELLVVLQTAKRVVVVELQTKDSVKMLNKKDASRMVITLASMSNRSEFSIN
jgi:hypothetical protein